MSKCQPVDTNSSWFNWFWTPAPDVIEEEDDSNISNVELYKCAKTKIETSKDSVFYAYKSNHKSKQYELSVCDTLTETNPVLYQSKKRPKSPIEILEKQIRKQPTSYSTVFPNFEDNFRDLTIKTKLRILSKDIICGMKTETHLYKQKKTMSKLNVVVIGVHSYLPNKLVRALIGKSSGNSTKYINVASESIHQYCELNNIEANIETIALEGQGKINDCVEKLYKLVINWINVIRDADFIHMITFGNSSPIGVRLIAQLITKYKLNHKKISLLNISTCLGFQFDLNSKLIIRAFTQLENDIIKELFEYNKPQSQLSIEFIESMRIALDNNVKFIFTSDINDFFTPLTTSLLMKFNHPNIYRNFIDSKQSSPNFIIKLFEIIFQMRNLGSNIDCNLVSNLQLRYNNDTDNGDEIYEIDHIYQQAILFSLETNTLMNKKQLEIVEKPMADMDINLIPWNLRCLLQNLLQFKHLNSFKLMNNLIAEFKTWQPLRNKEIRYCLEALDQLDIDEFIV